MVRNILRSEACELTDRAQSVADKLATVEMESIQDYVAGAYTRSHFSST